jgi:protein gp37
MQNTKIEWCDHTFNPWIGCSRVSPGCVFCYAEAMSRRYGKNLWGPDTERQRTTESYWKAPLRWNSGAAAAGVRLRVFCASMADVFDQAVPDQWRNDLLALIRAMPNLDWLILTKRPKEALSFWHVHVPSNIWLGVSVEDQHRAHERIPILASMPVAVRFLSVEPLLEPVNLKGLQDIHWVICGGESGPNARPMEAWWAGHVRGQCAAARVPFFMKQLGGRGDKRGKIQDFPRALQVREFPNVVTNQI